MSSTIASTEQELAGSPTSKLPQIELHNPSRTLFIHNHHLLDTEIQVTDITSHLLAPYSSPDFVTKAFEVAKTQCKDGGVLKPTYTISRSKFFSRNMGVVDNATGDEVAQWRLTMLGAHSSELTFPAGSKHCSHPVTVSSNLLRLKETFVVDSAELAWKIDRMLNSLDVRYKLVKTVAGTETIVARYEHPPSSMGKGGILSVDESEVDLVVAFVTCCVMIKKRTQKDLESFGIAS